MSILVNKNTRVVVQGITGKEGSFHATQCKAYGTKMVAGVTPGKAGQELWLADRLERHQLQWRAHPQARHAPRI